MLSGKDADAGVVLEDEGGAFGEDFRLGLLPRVALVVALAVALVAIAPPLLVSLSKHISLGFAYLLLDWCCCSLVLEIMNGMEISRKGFVAFLASKTCEGTKIWSSPVERHNR